MLTEVCVDDWEDFERRLKELRQELKEATRHGPLLYRG